VHGECGCDRGAAPVVHRGRQGDAAPRCFDEAFGNRQAKARTRTVIGTAFGAVEPFEHPGLFVGGYTNALVGDGDRAIGIVRPACRGDGGAIAAEFHGILQDIAEREFEQRGIGDHQHVFARDVDNERAPHILRPQPRDGAADHILGGQHIARQVRVTRLQAAHLQQVFGKMVQPFAFLDDPRQQVAAGGFIDQRAK